MDADVDVNAGLRGERCVVCKKERKGGERGKEGRVRESKRTRRRMRVRMWSVVECGSGCEGTRDDRTDGCR